MILRVPFAGSGDITGTLFKSYESHKCDTRRELVENRLTEKRCSTFSTHQFDKTVTSVKRLRYGWVQRGETEQAPFPSVSLVSDSKRTTTCET
jgi:hypothetical protein